MQPAIVYPIAIFPNYSNTISNFTFGGSSPQSGNKDPGFWGCTGQALGQNWKSLAIDGAALALNFAPGGIAAKYGSELFVGGLALGAVGISNSIDGMNPTRMGLNGASLGAGISGMLASVGGPAQIAFPGPSVGAVSKSLGGALGIASAGIDDYNTYLDYKNCRASKSG